MARGVGNRNAAWKAAIDQRVASGGQLGLSYLQGLASQYNIPYSQITSFINKAGYSLGAKAGAAATPTAPTIDTTNRLAIGDIGKLEQALKIEQSGGYSRTPSEDMPGYRTLADYMGVNKINSESEIKRALQILGGATSPLAAAQAATRGITNYNSLNDYLQILGGGIGRPAAAAPAEPTTARPTPTQTPETPRGPSAADAILEMADKLVAQMNDQAYMSQLASAEQARIQEQASRTLAANLARSNMMPNLQIQPATGVTRTGGTQSFRRRNDQFNLQPSGALGTISGLSASSPAIINI